MTQAEGVRTAGEAPDFHSTDMWNAIERGDYPTWTLYAQVMKPEEAENYRWNIFDMTKVWPHKDFPLRPLGKLTLNRNVSVIGDAFHRLINIFLSNSPKTTSPTLSKLPFRPRQWCRALRPPEIQVGRILCLKYCSR